MTSLSFYKNHGSNVRLLDLQTAVHNYSRAQGTFMLVTPLTVTSRLQLAFEGQGVVKVQALPTKKEAIKHLQSLKPLPKGSVRLRTTSSFVWEVSFDPDENSVLLKNKDDSTKSKVVRGGGMLIFDIEYGNVCVSALRSNLHEVWLDSINHSPHIQTVDGTRSSSAQLKHYNPLGLCRLDSLVKKGQTLRLRIIGNKGHPGVGPYLRLHMTSAKNHQLNVQTLWRLGTDSVFSSDVFYVEADQERQLDLSCCDGELPCFNRQETDNDRVIKLALAWPWIGDCLLWFEINKVSIRTKLLDYPHIESSCRDGAAHQITPRGMQDAPYEIPAPSWRTTEALPCALSSSESSFTHTLTGIPSQEQTEKKSVATQTLSLLANTQPTCMANYTIEETLVKRVGSVPSVRVKTNQRLGMPLCTQCPETQYPMVLNMTETCELQRNDLYSSFSSLSSINYPIFTRPVQQMEDQVINKYDSACNVIPEKACELKLNITPDKNCKPLCNLTSDNACNITPVENGNSAFNVTSDQAYKLRFNMAPTDAGNSACNKNPVEDCKRNVLSTGPRSSGSFFLSDGKLQCLSPGVAMVGRDRTQPFNRNTSFGELLTSHGIHDLKYQPRQQDGKRSFQSNTQPEEQTRRHVGLDQLFPVGQKDSSGH